MLGAGAGCAGCECRVWHCVHRYGPVPGPVPVRFCAPGRAAERLRDGGGRGALGAVPAAAGPGAGWRRGTPGGDFGVTTAAGEEGTCGSGGGAAHPPGPFRSGFGAAPLELGDAPSKGGCIVPGTVLVPGQ